MSHRRIGFTLIEILAVILILGLMTSLLLPAIGAGGGAALRAQGERLAGVLELARQRAIVTGKPHRVVIDLENGSYFAQWLITDARANGGTQADLPLEIESEAGGEEGINLAPPLDDVLDYYAIPNRFGGQEWLDPGFFFEGVDTPEGWIEQGEVVLGFDWDGTTDPAQIALSDPDNRTLLLDLAPLLDMVRIHEEID